MLFRCFGGCVLGSLDARPCCFPVPKEALLGSLSSQKSRCVSKLSPGAKWGLKILQHRSENGLELARPSVPAAMCDIEDHPSTGQKMGSFSSPGHAVSLFWRLRFGKPRWSEVEVRLKAKSRGEIRPEVSPEAAKIVSFLSVPAAAFDIEDHRSTGQKTGSWARQAWVLGSLDGQKSKCISKPSPGAK